MSNPNRVLMAGAGAGVLLIAQSAWAQATPQPAAKDDEPARISEVVVTAQKREERLQSVPLAISLVGKQQLQQQNIANVEDLVRAVPALTTFGQPGNPDTRFSLRGLNTQSFSITSEQAVSFVLDGVVLGRTPSVNLFDISRVEVLRGPQGTLFGKNSSAGVVSIVTNAPKLGVFEAAGHADFGDKYDYRVLNGVVNLPLGDKAALRLSVGESSTDGFIHNAVRNQDSKRWVDGARARLLWEPTPDLTINVIADYEKQKTTEQAYLQFGKYDSKATGQPVAIPGCGVNTIITDDSRVSCNQDPSFFSGSDYGYSAQIDYSFAGGHTLTSITSYRRYLQNGRLDVDGLPVFAFDNGNIFNNNVFTQEVRVASPAGQRLEYVVGAYYSDTNVYNYLTQTAGPAMAPLPPFMLPFNNPNIAKSETKNKAIFGQATWHATDKLSLIAGGRGTWDDVSMVSQSFAGYGIAIPVTSLGAPLTTTDSRKNFSWKFGAQYQISDGLMAYATATHGYKGPQIQFHPPDATRLIIGLPIQPATTTIVAPELPMDYEAGLKWTLFGGLIGANLNLFHTKVKHYQTSAFNATTATAEATNVPYATTKGVELDFFGRVSRNLTLAGGVIYNKATYGPFQVTCTPGTNPNCPISGVVNVNGQQMQGAPEWKLNLSGEYERNIGSSLQGFVGADVVYTSKINFNQFPDPLQEVDAGAVVGARIGVRSQDRRWSASLFARNLFDERRPVFLYAPYLLSGSTAPGIVTQGRSYNTESFRMIGISLDGRF